MSSHPKTGHVIRTAVTRFSDGIIQATTDHEVLPEKMAEFQALWHPDSPMMQAIAAIGVVKLVSMADLTNPFLIRVTGYLHRDKLAEVQAFFQSSTFTSHLLPLVKPESVRQYFSVVQAEAVFNKRTNQLV
eukprot:gnl/Spiro4/22661_TR11178_c0_g1_i1.p3 gnl/Spiro4/22661_TR11178_c0_g1~~gnl/Spiro4/22661_TR11178_c0_g1_i1.p3  ORF type:complete len:131 (+),score=28.81 gnl/Spiro4/22661_TR11178_c0_g1_i1:39-431(+)